MKRVVRTGALAALLVVAPGGAGAQGTDLRAEARVLQAKPDIALEASFDFDVRPPLFDALVEAPMVLAGLWHARGFTPQYRVRTQGEGLHVDDPTGIQGDLYPVERTAGRHVWVGFGTLTHALVPHFKGRMAMVLTAEPRGTGVTARVAVFVRTDSRVVGVLASAFFPLVKGHVERRIAANAADLGTILAEVSVDPQGAAARLGKEDAAALLRVVNAAKSSR